MKDKLINWSILLALMVISIIPGFVQSQVVSGSVNTPSGYSIDLVTGNLVPYDSSLKTDAGVASSLGTPAGSFNVTDGYTFGYVNETIGFSGINLGGYPTGYQNTGAVFVTGFTYGLKYRFPCANSIGGTCDNTSGPQDTLRVEIGYYPATGSPEFRIHQLGLKNIQDGNSAYNPNWQQLAETWTFSGAKPLAQAGAVNFSIIGQDAGFWACLMPDCYGPQVKDAYVRANYSVDPCILNPAFNPSCPGFQNVLQGPKSPAFYYSYNIAQSLPHIGGGVQLHGYDYGFSWWNYGSCYNTFMFWCTDWRTDGGGNINFSIKDKLGNALFENYWYVSGDNSGGSYASRYLFTESRNSLDMGNINWWTSSVWNHFGWVGWTRPIWSPDPCYDQPLYSPNCSNFDAEIKRLAAEQKTTQEAQLATTVASVTTTPTSTVTTTINDATTTSPSVTVTTVETEPVKTTSIVTSPQTTNTTAETTNGRNITKVELPNSTELALNLIRQNQQRETGIAQQASQTAMQTANQAAVAGIKQAEALALDSARNSQQLDRLEQHSSTETQTTVAKQDQLLNFGSQPASTSVVNIGIQQRQQQAQVDFTPLINATSTSAVVVFNAMQPTSNVNQDQVVLILPVQPASIASQIISTYQPPQQPVVETKQANTTQQEPASNIGQLALITPQQQVADIKPATITNYILPAPVVSQDIPQQTSNFTTDRTNPLNSLLEAKQTLAESETREATASAVKQNTEDSTVAGPVNLTAIAVVPVGFSAYTIALVDASFYQPKEIYRNQRTIDNRRALQNLRSDQLHEQMINQQWR